MKISTVLTKSLFPVLMAGILSSTFMASTQAAGQKYALLIGVNDYADSLTDLQFCRNDVQELRDVLVASGFPERHVICMCDGASSDFIPSKSNIDRMLQLWLLLARDEKDTVVVAFSGHGFYNEDDHQSYLCPFDANTDNLTESCISMENVYAQLHRCRAGQKVLMIDACRNMTQFRSVGLKSRGARIKGFVPETPTTGIRVMSSCEAGQVSVEDPELQHGVFMYYVSQALQGKADEECEGNKNGKVSLDELYHYAHQRTKIRAATKHRTSQLPCRKGEITGLCEFEIASRVPGIEPALPVAEAAPPTTNFFSSLSSPSSVPANANGTATPHSPAYEALSRQGRAYQSRRDYANAIAAYSAIVEDTSIPTELRKKARRSRGAAYLARAKDGDIEKAIIDNQAAGLDGIRMSVQAAASVLKLGTTTTGTVESGQVLLVTQTRGDWLWANSVNGDPTLKGWIAKSALVKQVPTPTKTAYPTKAQTPQVGSQTHRPSQPSFPNWPRSQNRGGGWARRGCHSCRW